MNEHITVAIRDSSIESMIFRRDAESINIPFLSFAFASLTKCYNNYTYILQILTEITGAMRTTIALEVPTIDPSRRPITKIREATTISFR